MIYPVAVKRMSNGKYFACCTSVRTVFGVGDTMDEALMNAHRRLLCFVHDKEAALDVVFLDVHTRDKISAIAMLDI